MTSDELLDGALGQLSEALEDFAVELAHRAYPYPAVTTIRDTEAKRMAARGVLATLHALRESAAAYRAVLAK